MWSGHDSKLEEREQIQEHTMNFLMIDHLKMKFILFFFGEVAHRGGPYPVAFAVIRRKVVKSYLRD